MNVFTFTGNLGRDCETRYTPKGDSIVSFSVGVASGYGDKAVTTWVNCNLWGKRGESVAHYLKKGQQVAVSGELTNRKYQDKEGNDKWSLEVRVNDVTLIGKGSTNSDARQPSVQEQKPNEQNSSGFDDFEDDIPF
jgi:single-strand DNA-binding protein